MFVGLVGYRMWDCATCVLIRLTDAWGCSLEMNMSPEPCKEAANPSSLFISSFCCLSPGQSGLNRRCTHSRIQGRHGYPEGVAFAVMDHIMLPY